MSNYWGMELSLDLYGCNPETIRSKEKLAQFVTELCDLIKVRRFGEATIVNFGEDERIAGFSLVQLIETSLVSGHFANQTNTAYINVFSCKDFDHQIVEDYCVKFFEAESAQPLVNYRK